MAIHKLRGLQYLVAVVDHGGFNAAARHLGVAAPSVHRLVQALEAELGLPLIDRSAQPLKPTPSAAAYVERARALLDELRELDAGLRDQGHAPRGTLAIAAHGVVLQFVLAEALPRFHARYPEVRVELLDAGSSRDLARLGTDALLPFGVMRRWAFERGGERVDVGVDGWLVSDSRSALDAPLYGGHLAARINDLTAHPGLADGTLQPVLLDWHALNAPPLSLLVRRSLARQPRMRAWVDFLVETAERLTRQRLPAGLPPVPVSARPDWWRRRVAAASRRAVAAAGR